MTYKKETMFSKSEKYYDEIYGAIGKDYVAEANKVHRFVQKYKHVEGNTLLDVACGTGGHAGLLSKQYKVEGLDLDANMLQIASKKHPGVKFHHGTMTKFEIGHQFTVVTCLFSSIGYVKTKSNLQKAIKTMSNHLLPGGVLLVEPWFTPEQWYPGRVSTLHVDKPDMKIVRMSLSGQKGNLSFVDFQYLIGTSKGIEHHTEIHELGLFTHEEYLDVFRSAGLKVIHNKRGLDGRGLYIGMKAIK
jgi:ubiquinone/menaquinone biosynthesis C-methylase UbiE